MSWQELLPHIGARAGEGRAGRACMLGVAVIILPFSAVFTVARSATMACHAMRAYKVRRHAKHQADVDVGWFGASDMWRMAHANCTLRHTCLCSHAGDYLTVIIMQYCSFGTLLGAIEVGTRTA
jgi:hypothetical protein